MGHKVEKYSWEDAFPGGLPRRLPGQVALFALRADRFIRANGHRFDVIDAQQGNVIHSKRSLRFGGTLVIRSVGLAHFYEAWERSLHRPPPSVRSRLTDWLRTANYAIMRRVTERSFDIADRILLINDDETAFVSDNLRWAGKAREVPNALSTATWRGLSSIERSVRRPGPSCIVFLGAWGARKGGKDWALIVKQVWEKQPGATFLFLGTGVNEADVRSDLGVGGDPRVEVVAHFDPQELPHLLTGADIGAFPSYIEGLPIGVLEQLAAGIGVVAYDVPGSRQLLRVMPRELLVDPGDTAALAERLVSLLDAEEEDAARLAAACRDVATRYTWGTLARQTIDVYGGSKVEAL